MVQRVFESIAAARGAAFDQTTNSIVGAENVALARAIAFDLFDANARFANEMNPAQSTLAGLLPRWEKILAQPPQPGDFESDRQARVAAALARHGRSNSYQPVADELTRILGPLFVGLTLFTPANALVWWPGFGGSSARIIGRSGNLVFVTALAGVPSSAAGANFVASNAVNAGNNGTFVVQDWQSATDVVIVNNGGPVIPDYGIGGVPTAGTIQWTMPNPVSPWTSTVAHVDILVNPRATPGYVNPDGTVNGKFYAKVNQINPVLDLMLPADCTFDWYVNSSHGAIGFYLDEPNLDLLAFD